ncbi:hypothetical protein [Streptomyces sp. NPDC060194]|uniref:hypothetical protein n=1 Tax=Streptomyces sp. NPDC060194 TaxID=3347069 RepID=UPI00365E6A83
MSDDEINTPLPRMTKQKAEAWARHWSASMARTAGATIVPARTMLDARRCIGKGGELPADGRFFIDHGIQARLPKGQHADAIRKLRAKLEEQGLHIDAYRAVDEPYTEDGLEVRSGLGATHPTDHHHVSVDSISDDLISFAVYTPCLLPPGVEQQQF